MFITFHHLIHVVYNMQLCICACVRAHNTSNYNLATASDCVSCVSVFPPGYYRVPLISTQNIWNESNLVSDNNLCVCFGVACFKFLSSPRNRISWYNTLSQLWKTDLKRRKMKLIFGFMCCCAVYCGGWLLTFRTTAACPEDGGSMILWNVSIKPPHFTAQQLSRKS